MIGKTGWTHSTHSPGAPLTINVEFKEDWILLSLAAPKTHAASPVVESLAPEKVATPEVPAIAVPAGSAMEGGILKIDGSFLGGGRGHILRSAMTYAAVLGISVGVHNIRKSSVGETGLQPRDAAILEGLTKLAGGKIQGGTVGSPFVTFSFQCFQFGLRFVCHQHRFWSINARSTSCATCDAFKISCFRRF